MGRKAPGGHAEKSKRHSRNAVQNAKAPGGAEPAAHDQRQAPANRAVHALLRYAEQHPQVSLHPGAFHAHRHLCGWEQSDLV